MEASAIAEALAAAMTHCNEPMVLADPRLPDCPMVVMNQAFIDLTGYPRAAMIGRNCRFLQGPKTDPDAAPRIRTALAAGEGCIEWIVNYRQDGSLFWNLLFISPVRAADGTVLFYFGNQCDITRGTPGWLGDIQFGPAHVSPALEGEFHALLADIGTHAGAADSGRALARIVVGARRLAEISVRLAPGTLDDL